MHVLDTALYLFMKDFHQASEVDLFTAYGACGVVLPTPLADAIKQEHTSFPICTCPHNLPWMMPCHRLVLTSQRMMPIIDAQLQAHP